VKASTSLSRNFAHFIWNPLPGLLQREVSLWLAKLYQLPISKYFIGLFCDRYNLAPRETGRYEPASRKAQYQSFQDFFTRRLVAPLPISSETVWPCQGYVCDFGYVGDLPPVAVKGQVLPIRYIFNRDEEAIPNDYYFLNIFLHNHNYHRFHAPISGRVKRIEHLAGQLTFLRPWLYKRPKVSEPSFRNERIVIEIECEMSQKSWFLSFVGGMGVGQIRTADGVKVGSSVRVGQEIGLFLLGSTCCIAMPESVEGLSYMQQVDVGDRLEMRQI
jgi:phosphatidylserine decarboxylase